MRGWNGNSRMVASGLIMVVTWTQHNHSGLSVKHVHRFKNMYVLQNQTLIQTYLFQKTWSSKRPYEKPVGVQQTCPSLLKSTGWIEDIFLFSREVILDVSLLHCHLSTRGYLFANGDVLSLLIGSPLREKACYKPVGPLLCLWGSTVSSLLVLIESWGHLCVQHLLESIINETNYRQRKAVLLATDNPGSQKTSLEWIGHFCLAEVRWNAPHWYPTAPYAKENPIRIIVSLR